MKSLDYAIQMELDGQKYYLEQAEKNKDNELYKVFMFLSDSEKEHAAFLQRRKRQENVGLDQGMNFPMKTLFNNLQDVSDAVRSSTQLDGYRFALTQEEKSIELYQEMLANVEDEKDKELYEFLLKQEKEHLILFEQLVTLLQHPEEWVESAEFGIRKDY